MQQKSVLSVITLLGLIASTSMQAAVSTCGVQNACNQVVCASVVKAQKICADEIVVKSGCGQCHTIGQRFYGRARQPIPIGSY